MQRPRNCQRVTHILTHQPVPGRLKIAPRYRDRLAGNVGGDRRLAVSFCPVGERKHKQQIIQRIVTA